MWGGATQVVCARCYPSVLCGAAIARHAVPPPVRSFVRTHTHVPVPRGCACASSADQLLSTKVLRLDFQRIPAIDNLEVFTHVTDLYLQHVRTHSVSPRRASAALARCAPLSRPRPCFRGVASSEPNPLHREPGFHDQPQVPGARTQPNHRGATRRP